MVNAKQFLAYRPDDHADSYATATKLTGAPAATAGFLVASAVGNIERSGDKDWFSVSAGAKGKLRITISATPNYTTSNSYTTRQNVDFHVAIYNENGAQGSSPMTTPFNSQGSWDFGTREVELPWAGVWYMALTGVGDGTNATVGYTNYGSLGE